MLVREGQTGHCDRCGTLFNLRVPEDEHEFYYGHDIQECWERGNNANHDR